EFIGPTTSNVNLGGTKLFYRVHQTSGDLILASGDQLRATGGGNLVDGTFGCASGSCTLYYWTTDGSPTTIYSTYDGGTSTSAEVRFTGGVVPQAVTIEAGASIPSMYLSTALTTTTLSGAGTVTSTGYVHVNDGTFNMGSTNFSSTNAFTINEGDMNTVA